MRSRNLPSFLIERLAEQSGAVFADQAAWSAARQQRCPVGDSGGGRLGRS
jgi:hypothetical protein